MNYDSIINLKYEGTKRRNPMSMSARAAQFAPFAALTGHNAAIEETARQTTSQSDMSAEELQLLSHKIAYAMSLAERPQLSVTYFRPDDHKSGGAYLTIRGAIKKIEPCFNLLTLTVDASALVGAREIEIPLDAICDVSGEIFNDFEI